MANAASVSGSTGYNIPVNALDGGDAAPSSSRAAFGSVFFNDGNFSVGGVGNAQVASTPTSQVLPADLAGGLLGTSSSSSGVSPLWLILGAGAVLVAFYFLRRHK